MRANFTLLIFTTIVLVGCAGDGPELLAERVTTNGPTVRWDVLAKPLPEIPLPNDAATRLDPSSPTGRRLNISLRADTAFERRMREGFDTLDGFGTYAPILVQFDSALDVLDLWARHNGGPWPEGGPNRDDFRDDAVFLFNVDPSCERFGEEIALDIGRGRFPVAVAKHDILEDNPASPGGKRLRKENLLFEHDPRGTANNLAFEEWDEDTNGDGEWTEDEDTDFDGLWDRPNFMEPSACDDLPVGSVERDRCTVDQLMTFYDREDNTLILRPVWPMEERCAHAVVLTDRLRGENGDSIQSPFPGVHHANQGATLAPVAQLLPRYDLTPGNVAFAWSFTTGTMTRELEAVRDGLYGAGPFARLSEEFPPDVRWVPSRHSEADGLMEPGTCGGLSLTTIWAIFIEEWAPNMCAIGADYASLGGMVWGSYESPNLLVDRDGDAHDAAELFEEADELIDAGKVEEGLEKLDAAYAEWVPADSDERWELDLQTGEATYGSTRVPLWCLLPRAETTDDCEPGNPTGKPFCKPYPVIIFSHGYMGSRIGVQDYAGRHASMGYASCAIDAYGHGKNIELQTGEGAIYALTLQALFGTGSMTHLLLSGRDRDLNNDGIADPGGDFWTSDLFHTRDMLRQTALDVMQLVRILRSFDGRTDAQGRVAGDLDGDGTVDIGGPENTISMWGTSLGGILAGILQGAEPSLNAVSSNGGGAGLTDIGIRSLQAGVPEAVHLPIIGPLILGELERDGDQNPIEDGQLVLKFLVNDRGDSSNLEFARLPGVKVGDRITLTNLASGKSSWALINERGGARVAVAADALGPIERRSILGFEPGDTEPVEVEDTAQFGDPIEIVVTRPGVEEPIATLKAFPQALTFQGTTYAEGAPLVVLQEGLGHKRNSPDFRRFLSIAQHALDAADPAIWSAHAATRTRAAEAGLEEGLPPWKRWRTHSLLMPTAGDMQVPVNTGIAEGRTGGVLGSWFRDESLPAEHGWRALFLPDERWGHSADQELIERYVIEGVPRLERFGDANEQLRHPAVLFDIEDLSDGTAVWTCLKEESNEGDWSGDEYQCPEDLKSSDDPTFTIPTASPGASLRATLERSDGTFDAMRIPMMRPTGQHIIYNAQPFRAFDMDAFMVNLTGQFLGSGGRALPEPTGCDCSAQSIPSWEAYGLPHYPELKGKPCEPDDLNLCSESCAEAWGITTPSDTLVCTFVDE